MTEKAMFGAGCFWGVEAEFRKLEGVIEVASGYSGGHTENPTYGDVCSGATGHAEVSRSSTTRPRSPTRSFWKCSGRTHDPTQLNRQGPDVGVSVPFGDLFQYSRAGDAAHASKEKAQERYKKPIVTEIRPASEFYRAEEYHQRYFEKNRLARFFSF